jgi:hypothetical protein
MRDDTQCCTKVDEVADIVGGVLDVDELGSRGRVISEVYRQGPHSFPGH